MCMHMFCVWSVVQLQYSFPVHLQWCPVPAQVLMHARMRSRDLVGLSMCKCKFRGVISSTEDGKMKISFVICSAVQHDGKR